MSQNLNTDTVVVTGAAGFIGGITCIELKKKGYKVIGIDRRYTSHLKKYFNDFICTDFTDYEAFLTIKRSRPASIIHCAGTSLVGPSFAYPGIYFDNNVARTNRLLNFIKDEIPATKFIFSSSAGVYGNWSNNPYSEYNDTLPISPYGETKLMVEKILKWYNNAYNLKFVSLRYFNACGADIDAAHGQEPGASHILAKLFDAGQNNKSFDLYGTQYNTKDKTCIRDYVHVVDIADAHIKAVEKDITGIYNLGSFRGLSNLECIQYIENNLNTKIQVNICPAREGDPAVLIANPSKFQLDTGWKAWRTMPMIVEHLNKWYNSETYKSLINNKRS